MFFNTGSFTDSYQMTVFIRLADSSCHMSVFGQCIFQHIANHSIAVFFIIFVCG